MKKTLLQIAKYYYPAEGGIETVTKYIAEGLTDFENVIICFSEDGITRVDHINGIKVYRIAPALRISTQDIAVTYYHYLKKVIYEVQPDIRDCSIGSSDSSRSGFSGRPTWCSPPVLTTSTPRVRSTTSARRPRYCPTALSGKISCGSQATRRPSRKSGTSTITRKSSSSWAAMPIIKVSTI